MLCWFSTVVHILPLWLVSVQRCMRIDLSQRHICQHSHTDMHRLLILRQRVLFHWRLHWNAKHSLPALARMCCWIVLPDCGWHSNIQSRLLHMPHHLPSRHSTCQHMWCHHRQHLRSMPCRHLPALLKRCCMPAMPHLLRRQPVSVWNMHCNIHHFMQPMHTIVGLHYRHILGWFVHQHLQPLVCVLHPM